MQNWTIAWYSLLLNHCENWWNQPARTFNELLIASCIESLLFSIRYWVSDFNQNGKHFVNWKSEICGLRAFRFKLKLLTPSQQTCQICGKASNCLNLKSFNYFLLSLSRNRLNCEIDRCRDYCFNNGKCSVETTSNELKCECQFNFKGDRCEIDNRCENCGVDTNNCTIHCHNGGKCIKNDNMELCECSGEWKGIACNMLTCLEHQCGKCRDNSPIESCLWVFMQHSTPAINKLSSVSLISCDDGSTQNCLPPEDSLYHQDVTATEVPNENFKTLIVIIVAALVSVFVFVLIFATIIYVQRWQMRRFFNFSQLNENVEEITNPIFDLSGGGDDVGMPVTNVLSQVSALILMSYKFDNFSSWLIDFSNFSISHSHCDKGTFWQSIVRHDVCNTFEKRFTRREKVWWRRWIQKWFIVIIYNN